MSDEHRPLQFDDERKDVAARLAHIQSNPHPIVLVLDGIQNPRNLGAIFRIAEAARVKKIYLYQAELNINEKKFQRAARSAAKYLEYEFISDINSLNNILTNYQSIALEITNQSKVYTQLSLNVEKELALIIGNERFGVSPAILKLCDEAVHIPMFGINTSMNVVTATGIVLFEMVRKRVGF